MITLRPIRPSDINAIVSLYNRRLWQRHTGFDEWYTDPVKKDNLVAWDKLTLFQRYLNAGVWCDPILYKNHLNWLTRNGGISFAAEETALGMQRIVAFCEIWCAEEAAPLGKTGSIVMFEVDTTFVEDPVPKLYAQAKKEIRSRNCPTLAVCPFSSRAAAANLDDRRWEVFSLTRHYRTPSQSLTPSAIPHRIEAMQSNDPTIHELFCHDQSIAPGYQWVSFGEEFELLPEMKGAMHECDKRRIFLEYSGQNVMTVLWVWRFSDPQDYWKLAIWMPPERKEDRDLLFELVRIAGSIWNGPEVPGFDLCADEENGAFLINRGFTTDESLPAEPRYYTIL